MGNERKLRSGNNTMASDQLSFDLNSVQSSEALVALMDKIAGAASSRASDVSGISLLDPRKNVVMSNRFVVGLESGSRFAHKISRIAIGDIPMNATELPMTVITASDIEKMGFSRTRLTGHLNEVLDEILSYRIKVAAYDRIQKDARMTGLNVFSQATIIPGKGTIVVSLNPVLKEHFLNLKQDFTQYSINTAVRLQGYAASKLHELLVCRARQYGHNLFRFSIADLAVLLNYKPKGPYKGSTFVNSCIKRAVNNINDCTEARVRYKALRDGREYKYIRFYVEAEWRTLEEKKEYLAWEEACRDSDDPEKRRIINQSIWGIEELLKTGEGELAPEDIPVRDDGTRHNW